MKKSFLFFSLVLSINVMAGECEIGEGDSTTPEISYDHYSNKLVGSVKNRIIKSANHQLVGTVDEGLISAGVSYNHDLNSAVGSVSDMEIRSGDSYNHYSNKLVGTYQGDCTVEEAAAAALLLIIKSN